MNAIFVKFNRKDESSNFIFQIIKVQSQKKQEILHFINVKFFYEKLTFYFNITKKFSE
jgi:hypothetical protein